MPETDSTYDRILSYLKGLLSDRQRHDLEREMMHDEFDDEAFEGLTRLSGEELKADMDILAGKLDEKIRPMKKVGPGIFLRIAAGVLLLLGVGGAIYFVTRPPAFKELSVNKPPVSAAPVKEPMQENENRKQDSMTRDKKEEPASHSDDVSSQKIRSTDQSVAHQVARPLAMKSARDVDSNSGMATEQIEIPDESSQVSDELVVVAFADNKMKKAEKRSLPPALKDSMITEPSLQKNLQGKAAGVSITSQPDKKLTDAEENKSATEGSFLKPEPPEKNLREFRKWVSDRIDQSLLSANPGKHKMTIRLFVHENGTIGDILIKGNVPAPLAVEIKRIISQSPPWRPALSDKVAVESQVEFRLTIASEP